MNLVFVVCHTNLNVDHSKLIRAVFLIRDYLVCHLINMMVDATFPFCYILPFISCYLPPHPILSLSPPPPPPPHPSVRGSAVPAGLWSGGVRAQPTIPEAPATAPATDPSNAATLTSSTHRHVYIRLTFDLLTRIQNRPYLLS